MLRGGEEGVAQPPGDDGVGPGPIRDEDRGHVTRLHQSQLTWSPQPRTPPRTPARPRGAAPARPACRRGVSIT